MTWITDKRIIFGPISSPRPVLFRREFSVEKTLVKAELVCSAWGIYYAELNGTKIGDYFLTPGFTAYQNHLQMQTYDILPLLMEKNILDITVSGGWAVGRFGLMPAFSKNYAKKPALWFRLELHYADGTFESIVSDRKCRVGRNGYRQVSLYNGEVFDARATAHKLKRADLYRPKLSPEMITGGPYVKEHERFHAVEITKSKKGFIYDFGQNLAGVIHANIKAKNGQTITFLHAEIMKDGELFRKPLRSAKAKINYTARDGQQEYKPQMTYMGFRYVEVRGIDPDDIQLEAIALYSDIAQIGSFECSNTLINQLQRCIEWGAKSNFVDIPTDCPQRDERLGWTADTAVFASTACFNFGMHDLYEKWLLALRDDQGPNGQIPDVIPKLRTKSRSAPVWADACAMVPWASYMAYGDLDTLKNQYQSICRYIEDAKTHLTDSVWDKGFQYGDWCAPHADKAEWKRRGKYVGTCYFANSVNIAAKIAGVLGLQQDQTMYNALFQKICAGFEKRFVNEDGSIREEFQSAYVLPLYFDMLPHRKQAFAKHLARLVEAADHHLSTGFAGTPYLLFALADNGYAAHAYKILLQETCPSWLYEVKAGATTMWERWDALGPDGKVNDANNMVSFNHYAYGAVGDFLYRRIAGIEPIQPAYRAFRIQPHVGGGLRYAKASHFSPFGEIVSAWEIKEKQFILQVKVPEGTSATVILPSGETENVGAGEYVFCEEAADV